MKKIIIISVCVFAITVAGTGVYFGYFKNNSDINNRENLISLAQIQAIDSRGEKREFICKNTSDAISKKVCGPEYDNIKEGDVEKVDELFAIMDGLEKDKEISDYDRFMASKLIFVTLPMASQKTSVNNNISSVSYFENFIKDLLQPAQAQGAPRFISRAEYEQTLLNDYVNVKSDCPADGYQNWILDVSCSEYNNGKVVYSKEYFESGGPCAGSAAGQSEATHIKSIVTNKMKSEYDFINEKGVSSQISCSFTCASHNCPALEGEIQHPSCKNGSSIYIPMYDARKLADVSAKRFEIADEHADIECAERGYGYEGSYYGGGTERNKNLNCAIIGERSGEGRVDPVTGRFIYYLTYCCSCERPLRRIPFVHVRDYIGNKPKKNDIIKKLSDGYKEFEKKRDTPPRIVPDATPKTVPDTTPTPTTVIPPPVAEKKLEVPKDLCCLNAKAQIGERYYIPFDGSDCLPDDQRVPLDKDCANPLPVY